MNTSWQETAERIISGAIKETGSIGEENHLAIIAAKALLADLRFYPHSSYFNTEFSIVAFMPESEIGDKIMQRAAFNLLVNGLSGYFQWVSHNGGKFSVADALVHSEVMTAKESAHLEQFQLYCTHDGCNYFVIRDDFLARIVKKWNLPLLNPELGGKKNGRTAEDDRLLERLKERYPVFVSAEGKKRIYAALSRLGE
ncbi:MAG: hypothetical protein M0P97_03390 [Candidatus Moranbacteria bacterium]|jgi:hypothetical protein|nr:hypothetical protein [Candidatus Moranbacteria bacterium]